MNVSANVRVDNALDNGKRKRTTMTNSLEPEHTGPSADRGAVTITDVANAAGVSPSTVSYVITGKRPISLRTRRRVEESIRVLGYRRGGASAVTHATRIGVLAIAMPIHGGASVGLDTEFFDGAAEAARESRLDLLLITHDQGTSGVHRVMSAALADAVIVMDVGEDDPRVPILISSGRPAVLLGVPGRCDGLSCLDLDYAAAGRECGTHLGDLGHRSIAHIGPPPVPPDRHERHLSAFLQGFLQTATRHEMHADIQTCPPSAADVHRCLEDLLVPGGPTALVVHDEATLPLVLSTLSRLGRRIPDDVSVVALCSKTVAEQQRIRPTAVVVPARELGIRAVDLALRQLDGEPAVELELLVPRLIAGDSTGVAPIP